MKLLPLGEEQISAIMERGEEVAALMLRNRSDRLNRLYEMDAPPVIIDNELRMVSEALEALRRVRSAKD